MHKILQAALEENDVLLGGVASKLLRRWARGQGVGIQVQNAGWICSAERGGSHGYMAVGAGCWWPGGWPGVLPV